MDITDMDRLTAVQSKLCEVKTWVDETLRILNYVCIDEAHRKFKDEEPQCVSNASGGLYPGQIVAGETSEEECSS